MVVKVMMMMVPLGPQGPCEFPEFQRRPFSWESQPPKKG